ncbi:MAG: pirin family protein [Candidatus Competibacteraceae bacterium]|nr:pirin family protein [Candidatus Competibacteraceae bacterium]
MSKDLHSETSFSGHANPGGTVRDAQRLAARTAEIGGGISVARLLPTRQRRMIGAWCFLDHAGPATFAPGGGLRVGPHPHTCLQTFTWMLEGEILHHDSLGNEQMIRPGQVNLMTAGHGIAHTEESPAKETRAHAAQLWIALPADSTDIAPAFDHYPELPRWQENGCQFTLLAGVHGGHTAPAKIYSPLIGMDLFSTQGAALTLPLDHTFEYGILPLEGITEVEGVSFAADELAYLASGYSALPIKLAAGTRALLIGGQPFEDPITLWWNFVGRDKTYIAQAQRDWESNSPRFGDVKGFAGPRLVAPNLPWATT